MKINMTIALLILALAGICLGQSQFARAIGGTDLDGGYSLIQTTDGGYVIAGWASDYMTYDNGLLVKFNSTGTMIWAKTIDGTYCLESILQTTDGGYVIVGGDKLIKLTTSGALEWAKSISIGGRSVVQTTDGGYAVVGYTGLYSDLYLVKFTPTGLVEWSRAVSGTDDDRGYSVVQTTDGGYAVAGYTETTSPGSSDFLLMKFSVLGAMEWYRTVGGTSDDCGYSVVQTTDGGYAVAGWTNSFGAGDLLLMKFSSIGSVEWAKVAAGTAAIWYQSYSVVQASDGGYAVAGGDNPLFLLKFSSTGSLANALKIVATDIDSNYSCYAVVQTDDEGYAIVGDIKNRSGGTPDSSNIFFLKIDSEFNSCIGEEFFPTVTDVTPTVTDVVLTVTDTSPAVTVVTLTVTEITPAVTEICTNEGPKRAMWVWYNYLDPPELSKYDQLLDFCENPFQDPDITPINTIYVGFSQPDIETHYDEIRYLNSEANARDIKVEALMTAPGANGWTIPGNQHFAFDWFGAFEDYMTSPTVSPDERFCGLHIDLEPAETTGGSYTVLNEIIDSAAATIQRLEDAGIINIVLGVDIASYFPYTPIIDKADYVCTMDYYVEGTLLESAVSPILSYAETVGKEVVIGFETNFHNPGRPLTPEYTFYKLGYMALGDSIEEISASLSSYSSLSGIGIHCYEGKYRFLPRLPRPYRSMWVWGESDEAVTNLTARDELLDFCDNPYVYPLYGQVRFLWPAISIDYLTTHTADVRSFLSDAHSRGISVHFLAGDPSWIEPANRHIPLGVIGSVLTFNNTGLPNERFDGVQFDIEPHGHPDWGSDMAGVWADYIATLDAIYDSTSSAGIYVGHAIPRWFDDPEPITDLVEMMNKTDYIAVMDYWNTREALIYSAEREIFLGDSLRKDVYIGVETSCEVDPVLTFCGLGYMTMEYCLGGIFSAFIGNPSFNGCAIHDYNWYKILAYGPFGFDYSGVSFNGSENVHTDTTAILGLPDGEYVSLGIWGEITVELGCMIYDSVGVSDLTIWGYDEFSRSPFSELDEHYFLYIGYHPDSLTFIGRLSGTSQYIDFSDYSIDSVKYIRIWDDSDGASDETSPGYDIDAVGLGYYEISLGIQEIALNKEPRLYYIKSHPNPFNSSCRISTPEDAIAEIFDIEGRKVGELPGGEQVWKPESSVGSGVYLVRAKFGDRDITKRVVYLK